MRKAWDKYRRGDHISNKELDLLIKDTEKALDALRYRKDFGCAVKVLAQDLVQMEGFQRSRNKRNK